jgi:hypothetical protein
MMEPKNELMVRETTSQKLPVAGSATAPMDKPIITRQRRCEFKGLC